MKKVLIVLFALTSVAASAADTSDGCGLGWAITQRMSFLATSTRATTNAFVPPTFGMTSGTIGCAHHSLVKNEENAVRYAMSNYEPLANEMAIGTGETLAGMAHQLGCPDSAQGQFGKVMQAGYSRIYSGSTDALDMYDQMKREIGSDSVLSAQCSLGSV